MLTEHPGLVGIGGRPYIDLSPLVDTSKLGEIDAEICYSLAQVGVGYTGGSHKWMGIVPSAFANDQYIDYGMVISRFTRSELMDFIRLGENPEQFDLNRWEEYAFGEETAVDFTWAQIQFLKFRYGVYFPWKIHYPLGLMARWEEKHLGTSSFTPEAEAMFPKTCAFIRSLPLEVFGRCDILGLEANDHATVHRDGLWVGRDGDTTFTPPKKVGRDPYGHNDALPRKNTLDQFITFCPGRKKRLFLWDDAAQQRVPVSGKVYWFNDNDYHGVEADPYFRYSIRVDGTFSQKALDWLRDNVGDVPLKAAR